MWSMYMKYPRAKPYFSEVDRKEITSKIDGILKSGHIAQGKYVAEFEDKFSEEVGSKHGIATNSCTSALEVSIRALGIKNKTILVPTNTFVASVNSIILSGNTPLIVDIDEETLCMSLDSISENMSNDVGAILWVTMAGLVTTDVLVAREICKKLNIHLIEDAAHAHGASVYDSHYDRIFKAGNIGDVGCFSFYPSKVLATGEGGMITTNNDEVADRCRIMRYHGVTRAEGDLEGVDYGVCFSSGMSAVDSVLKLLKAGDHVICSDDVYGGVSRHFNEVLIHYGLEFTYVNSSNPEEVENAVKSNTKLFRYY